MIDYRQVLHTIICSEDPVEALRAFVEQEREAAAHSDFPPDDSWLRQFRPSAQGPSGSRVYQCGACRWTTPLVHNGKALRPLIEAHVCPAPAEPLFLWYVPDLMDPASKERPLATYTDGVFTWAPGEPRFDGKDALFMREVLALVPSMCDAGERFAATGMAAGNVRQGPPFSTRPICPTT